MGFLLSILTFLNILMSIVVFVAYVDKIQQSDNCSNIDSDRVWYHLLNNSLACIFGWGVWWYYLLVEVVEWELY